ncbi:PREDICTED: BMP and activin membrane-bound inhibitor homolog [Mandrillus leucophaeus]|uniref:BMP and activin membrane-bound inhibitor homolog n=2 Tax=Cercopithecinae TaxID=9528 RepID=A0A2K5Y9I7_MANLE|nr:PREDICTED: BMP and activin membrane-bound inhibitor homolog [Mandrillus leucophaeus]
MRTPISGQSIIRGSSWLCLRGVARLQPSGERGRSLGSTPPPPHPGGPDDREESQTPARSCRVPAITCQITCKTCEEEEEEKLALQFYTPPTFYDFPFGLKEIDFGKQTTNCEIRCYCDAAHCVATGYMCKSELSACFSRLLDPQNSNSPLTHGCLDSLASTADICQAKQARNHSGTTMPTLECCHEDMCNYRGLHDVLSPPKGEASGQGNRYQHDGSRNLITKVQELTSSKELWFRAAVIAVPIAGGLILVLLIMLALRMLRSENKRLQDQRQQMLSRLHYSFHGHHSKKGQVAKLDLECMVPVSGHENCCLTCDKMRQADLSNDKILSLVHWGMYSGHGKLEFV